MLDQNKTGLTHRVTAVAAAYLDGLGCKPVETEVPVQSGWTADVASYWYPTHTESKRLHLNKHAAAIWPDELLQSRRPSELVPRVFGPGPFTVLVEVKTTRADFTRDTKKWITNPPAHFCFLAYPTGVVTELPENWYGIETTANGRKVRKVHRNSGRINAQHPGFIIDFIAAVGIRRDHRTRHAALRDWAKHYNAEDRDRRSQYSAARLLTRLADWLQGDGYKPDRPLPDVLGEMGIKACPKYADEAVRFFESLKRQEVAESSVA